MKTKQKGKFRNVSWVLIVPHKKKISTKIRSNEKELKNPETPDQDKMDSPFKTQTKEAFTQDEMNLLTQITAKEDEKNRKFEHSPSRLKQIQMTYVENSKNPLHMSFNHSSEFELFRSNSRDFKANASIEKTESLISFDESQEFVETPSKPTPNTSEIPKNTSSTQMTSFTIPILKEQVWNYCEKKSSNVYQKDIELFQADISSNSAKMKLTSGRKQLESVLKDIRPKEKHRASFSHESFQNSYAAQRMNNYLQEKGVKMPTLFSSLNVQVSSNS